MQAKMCGLLEHHNALSCWERMAEGKNTISIAYCFLWGALGCKQSGLRIVSVFFAVLRPWLHGWLWIALLFKLPYTLYLNVKGYNFTNNIWGRWHTSTETTPAEFVIGPKTAKWVYCVLQEMLFSAILGELAPDWARVWSSSDRDSFVILSCILNLSY